MASPPARSAADVVDTPPMDQLHWGMLFVESGTGRVLLERNAHRKFIPASNVKVPVTAAALARLGPDHRFHTRLHAVGETSTGGEDPEPEAPAGAGDAEPVREGVLRGDLVLTGTGDPTLSARYWPDDLAPLEALADSVAASGIQRVEGALVVDASRWDSTTVAGSWMVSNLPWYYSATGGAFAVAEGETRVVVRGANQPGVPATVEWFPAGEPGFVVTDVTTGPPGADADLQVSWLPERRRLHLQGTVPPGSTDTLRLATRDPVRQSAAALHRILVERGIQIRDGWRVAWDPGELVGPAATLLADLASPPLIEVVEGILEPSQNWMSEQLLRYLGASDTTRASWSTGIAAVEATLVDRMGVDSLDIALQDGSGMSAYNLITPRALVRVLEWTQRQPWGAAYREALAEPGEEDSTLEQRLTALEGALYAKTGTISNVNALSGFLVTADGRRVMFSLMTNGSGLPATPVRAAMDEVVRSVAGGG